MSSTAEAAAPPERPPALAIASAFAQGAYFAILGIWPLVSITTFEAVSGKKTDNAPTGREADHWLVFTVGALITVIGATLLLAARRRRLSPEIILLAAASAAALAAIDIIYVARNVIAPIYLADAAIEVIFILAWLFAYAKRRP